MKKIDALENVLEPPISYTNILGCCEGFSLLFSNRKPSLSLWGVSQKNRIADVGIEDFHFTLNRR